MRDERAPFGPEIPLPLKASPGVANAQHTERPRLRQQIRDFLGVA